MENSETVIVRNILSMLIRSGILAWRMPVQGVMQQKMGQIIMKKSPISGFPDIACLYMGKLVCFEVKTAKGKLAPHQKEWIEELNLNGARALVVRSVEEAKAFIEKMQKEEVEKIK